MIDFHSHILPNIDDGSRSIEETFNLIKEAEKVGFEAIISTSHYMENYYETDVPEREVWVKAILENLGFTVDIAESSNYLVDKIKYGEKYDIIFSNNIYRDGTGPECLEKLKNVKGFSTPVIVHTITKDARNHFVNEIGFDDYIEKPVTKDNLIPILEKIFNK